MFLHIKAKPGSRENKILQATDGSLVIKIKAPATEGKANAELIRFLSKKLGVSKSSIQLVTGAALPFKKLKIDAEESEVMKKLGIL